MSRIGPAIGLAALFLGVAILLQGALPTVFSPSTAAPTPTASASVAAAASSAVPSPATTRPARTPLPPMPDGWRVQVPRLGIDLAILEGDIERDTVQLKTPENYAFHLPGTAIPGTGANSYIYAHARVGMFLSLWDAKVGDIVWLSSPDGRALKYVVSEVHPRIPRTEVVWATPSSPERVTLQTSTGPNPGDPIFIVVATPG
ncbi:MAG TPA: sortase [Candidatus Limnocylindrales bacterium]|nr:sortase [Candidatus Limnocylindrales bacterium]